MGSKEFSDEKLSRVIASVKPIALPQQAYGPQQVEWFEVKRPVWAWAQWPNRAAERIEARANGRERSRRRPQVPVRRRPLATRCLAERGERPIGQRAKLLIQKRTYDHGSASLAQETHSSPIG